MTGLKWETKDGRLVDPPETVEEMTAAIKAGKTPTDEWLAEFEKRVAEAKA